jgi:Kef-type K+ transport system membrane component KefB
LVQNPSPEGWRELRPLGVALFYGLMIAAAVAAMFLICGRGSSLVAPLARVGSPVESAPATPDLFPHVLIALAAVIATGLLLGRLLKYLGQPSVIGEVLAGILLGPSLLGPRWSSVILPSGIAPTLGIIAQLGVVLYMFVVGLELHVGAMGRRAHTAIAISHASIAAPFVLGALLALDLYPRLSNSDVPFTSFALFLGVAMSITAFPVLARILDDLGIMRTEIGAIAMSCAAIDDITAWCLLAFAIAVVKVKVGIALAVALEALAYAALMILLVRPLLRRLAARSTEEPLPRTTAGFVLVALLVSAFITESIGIHALFGAFLFGAVVPHDSALARAMVQRLKPMVTVLLLPAFFAFTGMRTRIDLVSGLDQWLICGMIFFVAVLGKFGGTLLAASLTGVPFRHAAALGLLMNTRGLMELIVLNVGLDLRVISPTLFSMMVLMALLTTMMASPLLLAVIPKIARKTS